MDSSIAQMNCVLKVDVKCKSCRKIIQNILQNLYGVYKINIDAEQGTVKVSGKVNPSDLLMVLEWSGKHAELKSVNFEGEVKGWGGGYDYFGGGYGYGYGNGNGYNPYALAPYPYPPFGGFAGDYVWRDPSRLIMMPLSAPPLPPPRPPPLPLTSSSFAPRKSQTLSQQPPALSSGGVANKAPPPPAGNAAVKAVKTEAKSEKKGKCSIM